MPTTSDYRPSVSLAICTRNRPAALAECLHAVGQLSPVPDEIIVIDNSVGDPETARVALAFNAGYCVEPEPGLSHARNRALKESRCEIVAFLDDDALPRAEWLDYLIAPYADEHVAAVTGETAVDPQHAAAAEQLPPRTLSSSDPLWFEMTNFGGLGFGTNMSLRKRCCREENFFDVRLGRGAPIWIAEESHAFTKLLSRGYKAVHVPRAIVYHPDKARNVVQEATASFAYWLLLFSEFPGHRADLLRFLARRLLHKPLTWPRDPNGPGEIVSSGANVKLKAMLGGVALYLGARGKMARS
ncbi:MAG: glycosyltransferase family 2 protein [Terracidiphilus sp.]|nr:glycosyltransferase family 2 protein [Terracidiphilus sp.]